MRSNYGRPLREYLKYGISIREIIDFGELPVFSEASTFPAIYLTNKSNSAGTTIYTKVRSLDFKTLESLVESQGLSLSKTDFDGDNWSLVENDEASIMKKMDRNSIKLGKYVDGEINYGIKSGLNEAFIIDQYTRDRLIAEDPKSKEIIKPILVGDNIRKYQINFRNRYLIYIPWHFPLNDGSINGSSQLAETLFKDQYPSIFSHLSKYKALLSKRNSAEVGIRHEWYALQRFASDYYADFSKPKIVYPDIGMTCRFALDDVGYVLDTTCFEIPLVDMYLLSLLNSRLMFSNIRSRTPC